MANATVCIGYDFDAVSVWVHGFETRDSPTKLSRGVYGATVAVPRLLDLHDELDVRATFFTPGHTVDSFPEITEEVCQSGHDIQHHGWSHTKPGEYDSKSEEKADIVKGIESIERLTDRRPSGYRSPSWDFSEHTLDILRELEFEWDSSQMAHDFRPYKLHTDRNANPEEAYEFGEETDIVEIPVAWNRDDWPPFQYISGVDSQGGAPDEKQVFDMWREQFDWMYDHVHGGVFPLTFHPQIIGHPPRLRYLEELIRHIQEKPGAEFKTYDEVAQEIEPHSFG